MPGSPSEITVFSHNHSDVANEEDFIFEEQGDADTLVSVKEEAGSYLASLVIGVDRAG
jgi:hypothetical protein